MSPEREPGLSQCSGCSAAIRWIRTPRGRAMPVDAERVQLRLLSGVPTLRVRVLVDAGGVLHRGAEDPAGSLIDGYTPHWSTCPVRDTFRRTFPRGTRGSRRS